MQVWNNWRVSRIFILGQLFLKSQTETGCIKVAQKKDMQIKNV